MNATLAAALRVQLDAVLAHVGTVGDWRVGGTATAVPVVVSIAELADDNTQRPTGHERVRLADVLVPVASIAAAPIHADTLTIATGTHAGTWTALGIERRDDIVYVVRMRRSVRVDVAAPGASEVRR